VAINRIYHMLSSVFVFSMKIDSTVTSINLCIPDIEETITHNIIKDNMICVYMSALFHVIKVN